MDRYISFISHIFLIVIVLNTIILIAEASYINDAPIIDSNASGFKRVVFYYGWLNTSNLPDLDFDILVFSATATIPNHWNRTVTLLYNRGVKTFGYIHDGENPVGLGTSFKEMVVENSSCSLDDLNECTDNWVRYIEGLIYWYYSNARVNNTLIINGVFLDECDPGYFGITDPSNPYLLNFSAGLREIVEYTHNLGLKAFINGVRAYAELGDYYLWEDFVTIYNTTSNLYEIDPYFFNTTSSNPYEWVNGIAKYKYLKEKELLNRTIALSFDDPSIWENITLAYYAARVLGLAGWSFADYYIYSNGGSIKTPIVYEVGLPVTSEVVDNTSETLRRVFTSGEVEVVLNPASPQLRLPFNETEHPVVDGNYDTLYNNINGVSGDYSTIINAGNLLGPDKYYFIINASWNQGYTGSCAYRIYIDKDDDGLTGYRVHEVGAEYMIEAYRNGYTALFEYTGNGSTWSWREIAYPESVIKNISSSITVLEASIPSIYVIDNKSKIVFTTVLSDWSEDAVLTTTVAPTTIYRPSIYDDVSAWISYTGVITKITILPYGIEYIADAPPSTETYILYVPFTSEVEVYKNNTSLELTDNLTQVDEGYQILNITDNYTVLGVKVVHNSPISILVKPAVIPVPEYKAITLIVIIVTIIFQVALKIITWR